MNLNFLTTPVPHEEARRAIADKPAVAREVFDLLPDEMKSRAFTITGIEDFDVLQAVRDEIATIPAGADWEKVKKSVIAKISPWFTEEGAAARAETLMSHHAFAAYSSTQARIMDAMIDVFPYRQYLSTKDGKVRASHAALHGIILPANHEFWTYHTPPWEWNCRCQVVELTQEDRDEEYRKDHSGEKEEVIYEIGPGGAEKTRMEARLPENRRVLEGSALKQLDTGFLNRGLSTNVDVRTPKQRGGNYQWSARDTTLPYDEIKTRWDAKTAADFEKWAGKQEIGGAGSLMNWLLGVEKGELRNMGEFARTGKASVAPEVLARLLKAEPSHPVAQAVKLWGDDEERFTALMMDPTPEAAEWRTIMEDTLDKIKPMVGKATLYRGWSFETAEKLQEFMEEHGEGFMQKRIGMSASFDPTVAAREKFSGGEHSMIWVLQDNRSAMDARPLFEAVEAVAHTAKEEEAIIPKAAVFRFESKEFVEQEVTDSAGKTRKMRVFYLTEQ
jgi:hypothetical protein